MLCQRLQFFKEKVTLKFVDVQKHRCPPKVSVSGGFLVQMRENTDQENSEYGNFSGSVASIY